MMVWRNFPQPLHPPPGSPRKRQLARSELKRKSPLRAKRHLKLVDDPARDAWRAPMAGLCACGCGRWERRLVRHHVLLAQIVRREHGRMWDLSNSMLIAPAHHAAHHSGMRKIRLDAVPDEAVEFAVELLGAAAAMVYFDKRYDTSAKPEEAA